MEIIRKLVEQCLPAAHAALSPRLLKDDTNGSSRQHGSERLPRTRVSLFLLAVLLTIVLFVVGYQGIQTLRVLDVVEHDRDRWQQAGEVIEQLNLKDGSVVADVGSGAGYFALKLAPIVGEKGGSRGGHP
jgi:hypothetical protein